jgi:hypothetical protein
MRCHKWIVDFLRSMYCKKCSSSRIPSDLNKTSIRAACFNIIYSSYTSFFGEFVGLVGELNWNKVTKVAALY